MVAPQADGIRGDENGVDDHCKWHAPCVDRVLETPSGLLMLPYKQMRQACAEQEQSQNGSACDVGEEVSVVPPADAVIEPYAVVVLRLDTIVANTAVVRARWAPDVARLAVLGGDFHCLCLGSGGSDRYPFGGGRSECERVFVGRSWRKGVEITR